MKQSPRREASAVSHLWGKSYPPQINWSDDLTPQPLWALLDNSVTQYPDKPCVEFKGRVFTYAEIKSLSDRIAKGLAGLGFKPGMKLGLFLPNCPHFVAFYYGGLKAGAVIVNYNPLYAEEEIIRQVKDSGTDYMVTLDLAVLFNKFAPVFERTPLKGLIVSTLSEQLGKLPGFLFKTAKRKEIATVPADARYISTAKLAANDGNITPVACDPVKTLALLQYTGGTTGVPKAAALTHANIYVNALQCKRWFYNAVTPETTRAVGVLPLFHAFAMTTVMNRSLAVGGSMLLEPKFEAISILKLIHRHKPNILIAVPTLFTALMNHKKFAKFNLSSLQHCISGGASLPKQVQDDFESRTNCKIVEGYGLSEASPVCCINPIHKPNRSGSVGIPVPGTICEILSIEDRKTPVKQGERGEICFRGPQVMQGYWNNPAATADVIRNGRLHTGDVGYMDDDGYIFITDRLKEMINCSGYKVYPRQVEEAIYQHPAVKECAVFGVDDSYKGQAVRAAICVKEGEHLTRQDLEAFLATRLSAIERPKQYDFRAELPKTAVGKIQKKILIEEAQQAAAPPQEKAQ